MLKKKISIILIMIIIILGINIDTLAFDLVPKLEQEDLQKKKVNISLQISDLEDYEKRN